MKISGQTFRREGPCEVRIELTDRRESAAFEAALSGARWITGGPCGELIQAPRYPTPVVEPDPIVGPHFTATRQVSYLPNDVTPDAGPERLEPAVYVSHLCGYNYSDENYRRASSWMESAGFACMRSKRGEDGKYWEIWYLPGPFRARGPIEGVKTSNEIARLVCQSVTPGRVDLGGASWAMAID